MRPYLTSEAWRRHVSESLARAVSASRRCPECQGTTQHSSRCRSRYTFPLAAPAFVLEEQKPPP